MSSPPIHDDIFDDEFNLLTQYVQGELSHGGQAVQNHQQNIDPTIFHDQNNEPNGDPTIDDGDFTTMLTHLADEDAALDDYDQNGGEGEQEDETAVRKHMEDIVAAVRVGQVVVMSKATRKTYTNLIDKHFHGFFY